MEATTSADLVGHVQCSRGFNLAAFLAACISARAKSVGDPQEVLLEVENDISNILKEESLDGRFIIRNEGSVVEISEGVFGAGAVSFDELQALLGGPMEENKDEWIIRHALQTFDQVAKKKSSVSEERKEELLVERSDVWHVIGIFCLLRRLNVRQIFLAAPIQFNPLSSTNCSTDVFMEEMLKGFPVKVDATQEGEVPNMMALALVRVLSVDQAEANSLKLLHMGMGRHESSSASFSILLGPLESAGGIALSESPPLLASQSPPLWLTDSVTQLECNLDDITGEQLAYTINSLLNEGAVDAWVTPIIMKKGRPAYTLHCICHPENKDKLLEAFFRDTTTLGIRIHRHIPRAKLSRTMMVAQTPYNNTRRQGQVQVKVSSFTNGDILSMKPEFDHCEEISCEAGVPLKVVSQSALWNVQKQLEMGAGGEKELL